VAGAGKNKTRAELVRIRTTLGKMESFFHGTSSGLDPLTSLIREPVLISSGNKIMTTSLKIDKRNVRFFLLDTGVQGKTGPLVRGFRGKMKESKYAGLIANEYVPLNDKLIHSVIEGNNGELIQLFEKLSRLQLQLFPRMIPGEIVKIIEEGLNSKKYFLKLCGSGGGGFMLGITPSLLETRAILSPLGYPLIATGF
jgi:mevalonate kinase